MRVVVAAVPLRHSNEAAVPHERPVLRAWTYVDPAAKDEAVRDAIACRDWRVVVAVTKWGSVEGYCTVIVGNSCRSQKVMPVIIFNLPGKLDLFRWLCKSVRTAFKQPQLFRPEYPPWCCLCIHLNGTHRRSCWTNSELFNKR